MPRVMPITGALAIATLALAPAAFAQDTSRSNGSPWRTVGRDTNTATSQPQQGTTPRATTATGTVVADSGSIRRAVDDNMLEVQLGQLAQSRAVDTAVKNFGQRMVTDHGSMTQQWTTLARNNKISTGTDLDQGGRATVARLEGLSGATFDRAFMQRMIQGHEQDLSAFQRMASSAESPEVRQLASTGVTTIQQHLTLARQINSRLGTTATAGVPPRTAADSANRNTGKGNAGDQLRGTDRAFVQNVMQDHAMHVELAERAAREAKNNETRKLAERIQKDMVQYGQRWRELADRGGVPSASHLGKNHQDKVNQLKNASKNNFDRTYIKLVTQHLESVVPYFQKEGQAVQSSAVRRLVNDELPVIREDLNQARRLEGQAQANAQSKEKNKEK